MSTENHIKGEEGSFERKRSKAIGDLIEILQNPPTVDCILKKTRYVGETKDWNGRPDPGAGEVYMDSNVVLFSTLKALEKTGGITNLSANELFNQSLQLEKIEPSDTEPGFVLMFGCDEESSDQKQRIVIRIIRL